MTDEPESSRKVSRFRGWFNDSSAAGSVLGFIAFGIVLGGLLAAIANEIRIDRLEGEKTFLERENAALLAQQSPPGVAVKAHDTCPAQVNAPNTSLGGATLIEIEGESCIFRWNNPQEGEMTTVICPEGYICIFELINSKIFVTQGNGMYHDLPIYAAVLRFAPDYPDLNFTNGEGWQRDPCEVLRHEQNYYVGLDDARAPAGWLVMPFEFSC